MLGPRKSDAFGAREGVLMSLGEVVDPKAGKKVSMRSGQLEVVASPGGRSAWVFDKLDINGEPHAVMAILTNQDDIWLVEAVSVAHTPSKGTVNEESKKSAVVPPGAAGTKKSDDAAEDAVERFRKAMLDQELLAEDLGSRSDAIFVGPYAGDIVRGKKELKKLMKKRAETKTRAVPSGEITAAVTADGQLAWVTSPITRVMEEDKEPLPLRAFAVFEKGDSGWKMIALQEGVAIDAPGSGASFKKILPPAPEPEKPPEEAKVEKKKDDKKDKKKKKKKKKKKSEDD